MGTCRRHALSCLPYACFPSQWASSQELDGLQGINWWHDMLAEFHHSCQESQNCFRGLPPWIRKQWAFLSEKEWFSDSSACSSYESAFLTTQQMPRELCNSPLVPLTLCCSGRKDGISKFVSAPGCVTCLNKATELEKASLNLDSCSFPLSF
jgi:hypothetical protein